MIILRLFIRDMSILSYQILSHFKIKSVKFASTDTKSPKALYKYLLKQCRKLPKGPKEHYQFMVKQSFKQHINETDPQRINEIINRSYEDAEWILKKYLGKDHQ